jgi:hypothetical protein
MEPYGAPHRKHISQFQTGLKYLLGTFWQKLNKKIFFCQKSPRKVTRQKFFSK